MHLELIVNATGWALFKRRRANKGFRRIADTILARDEHTCQFCQFRAEHFQQVINLDGNYENNEETNLACACILCAQCLFIGGQNFGTIIHMPEFSQVELNHLCRVLFAAMSDQYELSDSAKTIYRSLRSRSQVIDNAFGKDTSESATFGQCLIDINHQERIETQEIMSHLRLLPFRSPIEKPIRYWSTLINPQFDTHGIEQHMV